MKHQLGWNWVENSEHMVLLFAKSNWQLLLTCNLPKWQHRPQQLRLVRLVALDFRVGSDWDGTARRYWLSLLKHDVCGCRCSICVKKNIILTKNLLSVSIVWKIPLCFAELNISSRLSQQGIEIMSGSMCFLWVTQAANQLMFQSCHCREARTHQCTMPQRRPLQHELYVEPAWQHKSVLMLHYSSFLIYFFSTPLFLNSSIILLPTAPLLPKEVIINKL